MPTIVALREQLDGIRRQELERCLAALGPLDPTQRAAVERLSTAIVNKIMHAPLSTLRRQREGTFVAAVRRLFHLDPADEDPGSDDEEP